MLRSDCQPGWLPVPSPTQLKCLCFLTELSCPLHPDIEFHITTTNLGIPASLCLAIRILDVEDYGSRGGKEGVLHCKVESILFIAKLHDVFTVRGFVFCFCLFLTIQYLRKIFYHFLALSQVSDPTLQCFSVSITQEQELSNFNVCTDLMGVFLIRRFWLNR